MSELLPLFFKLDGKDVLLVGAGPVAASKLKVLLEAGARVTVVAPTLIEEVRRAAYRVLEREFTPEDLEGMWLVVAAAPGEVNAQVARAAEPRRLFVLAVDQPESASVYGAAIVRRAGVTFAISTSGHAPALAGLLREGLEAVLPNELEAWTDAAHAARANWKGKGIPMAERRPLLLEALNSIYRREVA